MTKYSRLRRTLLQVSALSLALPFVPLAFGQNASDTTPTAAESKPAEKEKKIPVEKVKDDDKTAVPEDEDIQVLSPFEVTTSNKGYYSANTMSGTRMNSKIEDLGQSITVMTKEQMSDFAMRDINDVFDYMASTEGTNTYSQFETDRTGAVVDQVSLNPNNANRVRGIGNANIAFNNIAMTGRVPVDALWMEALELSRGPNANIFGLGNASGTVNQVPATANLNRNFTRIETRADSYGGWTGSIDVNRMLIKNKLSVRASYKNEHIGFVRKPAEENARRVSFQVKVQPFHNTTLAASYFGYKHNAVRPNYTTPRDYYTDWVKAGKPGWNPVTRLITFDDGRVIGNGNVLGSTTPWTGTPTAVFPGSGAEGRSLFLIGTQDENPYWTITRYLTNPSTPAGNNYMNTDPFAASVGGIGLLTTGQSDIYTPAQQPLYNSVARPIDDKSIYDWTKINLAGNSKAWDDVNIYMVQLDQIILNTPKHTLAFQGTLLREDSKRLENQPMGPASVNSNVGELKVDINRVNLDGTPNPYYGRPYLRSSEPYLRDLPKVWDTGRLQFAYRVDFSKDKGWSKWLGTQQVLGYYEYKDQQNWQYTYRHVPVGTDLPWLQAYYDVNKLPTINSQTNVAPQYGNAPSDRGRVIEQYYVGSTPGGGIEYAPNYFPEGAVLPFVWGPQPGAPQAGPMHYDVSPIAFVPAPGSGGGLSNVNTRVKTTGGVVQSIFLEGKLVATYGLRKDNVSDRNSALATLTPDLRDYNKGKSNNWTHDWREAEGKTKTFSVVARPFRDISSLKRTAERGGMVTKFLAEAATSFSPTYNKSDNFIAQGPAYDLFLNRLPNQSGTSKDIGFWMTALEGKLTIRYTKFDTKQKALRNGDISTMAQRLLRNEGFVANDAHNLRKQVSNWLNNVGADGNATNAQIAAVINMPVEQYNGLQTIAANNTYAAVNDMRSTGQELEVNFNPSKNWTVSASVTKTQSVNTAVGAAVEDFIAARMPIWTTLEDPRFSLVSSTPETPTTLGTATYSHTLVGTTVPNTVTVNVPRGGSPIPNGPGGHLLWWKIAGAPFNQLAGYHASTSAEANYASQVNAPMSVFRTLIGRPRPQVREYSAKFSTKYNLAGLSDNKILRNISVGGSARYASKGSIGFYGLGYYDGMDLTQSSNRILELDANRPIYSKAETYIDLFVSYNTKMFRDKVRAKFQLNVKNVGESGGGLQPTQAFFDGRAATYRIIDPRQFVLTMSFDL